MVLAACCLLVRGAGERECLLSLSLQKAGPDGISIFDAVDQQLGLKLERQTRPRPVLIVDSVNQKPTSNLADLEKILLSMPSANGIEIGEAEAPSARADHRSHRRNAD
jgi:Protein of unknown function (DUF3738)